MFAKQSASSHPTDTQAYSSDRLDLLMLQIGWILVDDSVEERKMKIDDCSRIHVCNWLISIWFVDWLEFEKHSLQQLISL